MPQSSGESSPTMPHVRLTFVSPMCPRVEMADPTLSHCNKSPRAGHFAAWEVSELFASELRAAFRSLR